MKRIALLAAVTLALSTFALADHHKDASWTGTVSDSHCGAKHAVASDGAAGCVASCVKGGAQYVLVSDGKVYELDAQDKFTAHAGHSVQVTGKLTGMAIAVTSVEMAK